MPPVGKSGPGMISISSGRSIAGLSISAMAAVDDLAQIVRRDVGRHADGDAAGAVDQQVREARRQHRRLLPGTRRSCPGNRPSPCRCPRAVRCATLVRRALGVAHAPPADRRRSEPKLPCPSISGTRSDQSCAMRTKRVIDRGVAVRVIFTHHVGDGARRLHIFACSSR